MRPAAPHPSDCRSRHVPDLVGICRENRSTAHPWARLRLPCLPNPGGSSKSTVLVADSAFIGLCRDKICWSRELGPLSAAVLLVSNTAKSFRSSTAESSISLIARPDGSASAGVVILTTAGNSPASIPSCSCGVCFPRGDRPYFRTWTAVAGNRLRQRPKSQWIVSKDQRSSAGWQATTGSRTASPWRSFPGRPHLGGARRNLSLSLRQGMRGPVNFKDE